MNSRKRLLRWLGVSPLILFVAMPLSCRQGAGLHAQVLSSDESLLVVVSRSDNLWIGVPATFPLAFTFGWPGASQDKWVEFYEIKKGVVRHHTVKNTSFHDFGYIDKQMYAKLYDENRKQVLLYQFGKRPLAVGPYSPPEKLPPSTYKIVKETLETAQTNGSITLRENGRTYSLKMREWLLSEHSGRKVVIRNGAGRVLIDRQMENSLRWTSPFDHLN